jgi:hypothetical protein
MSTVQRDLPSGTVTFLFTDIEGSTKLLHELGADGYADALAEHRRVERESFAAHRRGRHPGRCLLRRLPHCVRRLKAAAAGNEGLAGSQIRVRMCCGGHLQVRRSDASGTAHRNRKPAVDPRTTRAADLIERVERAQAPAA